MYLKKSQIIYSTILISIMVLQILALAFPVAQATPYNIIGVPLDGESKSRPTPSKEKVTTPKPIVSMISEGMSKISPKLLDPKYIEDTMVKYKELSINRYSDGTIGIIVKLTDTNTLDELQSLIENSYFVDKVTIDRVYEGFGAVLLKAKLTPEEATRFSMMLANQDYVSFIDLDDVASINLFDSHYILGTLAIHSMLGLNGSGVKVAVLDTGIEEAHPELNNSVIAWADFINGLPDPYDDNGHGTLVSGIIGARGVFPWLNGEGMWHAFNFDDSSEFNYPGVANLTYAINVAGYNGQNVTVNFTRMYWIESNFDYAYFMYRFDTEATFTTLASYTGTDFAPFEESFNLTVPAGATTLYLSFIYEPDFLVQLGGFWLDDIEVFNATDPTDVLFIDDVESPAPPPEVINSYLWSRTTTRLKGMAPAVDLMGAKVCTGGGSCPFSAILSGIEWATLGPDYIPNTGDEADIISMSLGGPAFSYDILMQAIDWAYGMGVVPVIAAGNSGPGYGTVESPAAAHGAIAVGAATKTNTIASFSSWGPSPVDYTLKPEIVAFGRHVVSTVAAEPFGYPPGTYLIAIASGTSFSTPMVSGISALIKQARPAWGPEEVRSALISTATVHLNPSSWSSFTMNPYIEGGGLVNPWRAVMTDFLPVPAKIDFYAILPGTTLTSLVDLVSYPGPHTVNVVSVELYDIDGNDWSTWFASPSPGDSFTTNSTMNVTINVPVTAQPNLYWGRILLDVNGQPYQVILGFKVLQLVTISGFVYDIDTGLPVANATINVTDPTLSTVYFSNTSDATGYFEVKAPADFYVRLTAEHPDYYLYITPVMQFSFDTTYNIYMTPVSGFNPLQVLVVKDSVYGSWEGDPSLDPTPLLNIASSLGITTRLWNTTIQGLAAGAVLSGDFPAVAWLAGGVWFPVADDIDMYALVTYSVSYGGGVFLEGGDIGWWHVSDDLMTFVAHAIFDADMGPGTYDVDVVLSHPVTYNVPPMFTIDSSGLGWPDSVIPVMGGFSVADWADPFLESAIVVYEPMMAGESKTVYMAYPYLSMSPSVRDQFVRNILVWLLDAGPPVYTGTNVTVIISTSSPLSVVAYWTPFDDPPFQQVTYNVYLNGTLLASGLTTTSFNLTPYVTIGNIYKFTVEAVDLVGQATNVSTFFVVLPPTVTGGAFTYLRNGTFTEFLPIGQGTYLTTTVSQGPASLQLLQLTSTPLPLPPTDFYMALDLDTLDLKVFNTSGIEQIVIEYHFNPTSMPPDVVPYWFNGTMWLPVSDFIADFDNGVVWIFIDNTTSPSLADLTGTPITIFSGVLNARLAVGGVGSIEGGHSLVTPLLILALAGLIIGGVALRRIKVNSRIKTVKI